MAETVTELVWQDTDITEIPLTGDERTQLEACESIIRKGLVTFIEVGRALAEIHDNRLYRESHGDFKIYCKDVWDLGQSTAYQKMDGYRAVKYLEDQSSAMAEVSEDGSVSDIILPVNERQVRPLVLLKKDPAAQLKAWALVQEELKTNPKARLTGALVNKAVRKVTGEAKKKTQQEKQEETEKSQKQLDETELVSPLFKRQCKVMEDIINDERNSDWESSSRVEVVKWLKYLVTLAEDND